MQTENHISNYYLLTRLASELEIILNGFAFEKSYSINQQEIILNFSDGKISRNLKGYFGEQSFIFPYENATQIKNTKVLFTEIEGLSVLSVNVHSQDRSFRIILENGYTLVFLMFGRNGNVLLFKDNNVVSIFRNQFEKHQSLLLDSFPTEKAFQYENFVSLSIEKGAVSAVKYCFKGFSKGMIEYLDAHDLESKQIEEQWQLIQSFEDLLTFGTIDVLRSDKTIVLTLIPGMDSDDIIYSGSDSLEALKQYSKNYFYVRNFELLKNQKSGSLKSKIEKNIKQLEASKLHLYHIENDSNYKHQADIIMANLTNIPGGAEKITLFDFYTDNDIEISLKRGMSPQNWAEKLYRKSKNQEIERQKTVERMNLLEKELVLLTQELSEIETITEFKELKAKAKNMEKDESISTLPFRHFMADGYDIYVGKSAANNDELTFDFSHKEDLWLHARDVSGSHVIIKHKSDGVFPKPVVERAAQIAAYYSKSKGSIMSPVIYTLRKFVRKPKGAAHGSVICEKEKMIMVSPKLG